MIPNNEQNIDKEQLFQKQIDFGLKTGLKNKKFKKACHLYQMKKVFRDVNIEYQNIAQN